MNVNYSTSSGIPFDSEAILSQASLEQIAKNITVPNGVEELRKCKLLHGTEVSEIPKVFQRIQNLGGGFAGPGVYVALDEPAIAIEYANIKTQFGGRPGIMEGRLNAEKPFVVGRIQVVRENYRVDLLKGVWPADWAKNPTLINFVHENFDIMEVCGMESAGLAMSTNRIAVVYERAGSDAIHWHKMYDLKNKPIPIELFQKNVPTNLPRTQLPQKVSVGSIAFSYGLTLLECFRFASCLRQGDLEEEERLPFVPPFGLHQARGAVRGVVRYVSDFAFHHIDPVAASIDPRMAIQAPPLDSETKKALKLQVQQEEIERNYWDEMLEHGVVPSSLSVESPSATALALEKARKWRTLENQIVDKVVEKLDLNEDPYVALEYSNLYSKMLRAGEIKLPEDFFAWSSKQQADWLQGLVTRAEFCFAEARRQVSAEHSTVAMPQGQTVSEDAPNFTPDLSLIEVAAPDLMLHTINPETLSRLSLNLPWRVSIDPVSGAEILQTAVEMAPGDMELIAQDVEQAPPPIRIQPRPPRPGFNELARFTRFELGEGIGGGVGFIGTQESGAQVSLSTTGDALITGARVPMCRGFLNGLGTGLAYTAPIAAIFLAINHVLTRHDSEVAEHLKKDNKAAGKEGQRVNASLQNFDQFADLYARGLIDEEAFLRDVNQITGQIHDAAHNMGSRGRYAERHDADGMDYFFRATSLRQIELDLKKIAAEAMVKRKVEEQYFPQLQGKPLPALASELNALLNKRVLTLSEKFMQDALIGEISVRSQSGDLAALGVLDQLAGRPVALALNPASVAKPSHISKSHYWDDPHSQERKAVRVKGWANKLDDAYTRFEKAAAEGNIPEMERAANDVAYQIQRAKGQGEGTHIHLKDYDLKNVKDPENPKEYIKTAWDYYKPYISAISSNVDTTLARARVAQSGVITNESPAIFTADEIRLMKVKTASDAFDAASNKLQDPSNIAGQEDSFKTLHQAAIVLNSLGITDPNVLKVIAIAKEHGTYGQFQVELARLNGISAKLDSLQEKLDGMQKKEESTEGAAYGRLYSEAFDIADELIKQGLSEADLRKLYQDPNQAPKVLAYLKSVHKGYFSYGLSEVQKQSKALADPNLKRADWLELLKKRKEKVEELTAKGLTEEMMRQILPEESNASDFYQWVKAMPEHYPHLLTIDHYENVIHHCYSAPAARFVMHVLNDQQRMRGPSFALRPAVLTLGIINTLAPDLLPRGVDCLIALRMNENAFVTNALFQKCGDAVRSNALTRLKGELLDPRAFLAKSFDSKVTVIQGANAVVQLVARGATACVSERTAAPISRGALVLNATANALYYVNTINRAVKYLEVSEATITLGMSGFDIYEFLATHPSEYGTSQGLIGTVKFYLPNFEGNLPESELYYSAKDVIATVASVAAGVFIKNPVLRGVAIWKSAGFFYNRYFSTVHTDDMLTAIMTNYRYFSVMKLDDRKNASMGKLVAFIGDKLKLERGDSPAVQKAKQYVFEHQIDLLELEKNWAKLAEETVIDLGSYTFVKRNIALADAVNVALKRHNALLNMGSQLILQSFDEFGKVSIHLDAYLSKLEEKHRSYVESVRSNLRNIKRCFLTNFCKYYVQNKIEVTTAVALMMFDMIPKEERDCIHWYLLGRVATELWERTGMKKHSLVGLQLLSFEASLEILQKKRQMGTLERFEEELITLCEEALKYLERQMKSPLPFNKDTKLFSPVVEKILSE